MRRRSRPCWPKRTRSAALWRPGTHGVPPLGGRSRKKGAPCTSSAPAAPASSARATSISCWPATPTTASPVLDALTYAGSRRNLAPSRGSPAAGLRRGRHRRRFARRRAGRAGHAIVNFAADRRNAVDRSLAGAGGVPARQRGGRLRAARLAARRPAAVGAGQHDEVYGDIPAGQFSRETDPVAPRSPYRRRRPAASCSAARSSSRSARRGDHPRLQHDRAAAISREAGAAFVTNALRDEPLPVYGDGLQVRDLAARRGSRRTRFDLALRRGRAGRPTTSARATSGPTSTSCGRFWPPGQGRRADSGTCPTGRATTAATALDWTKSRAAGLGAGARFRGGR